MSSAALTMVTLTCVLSRTLAFSTRAAAPRVLSRAAGTAAWRGASPGFSAGRPLWLSPRTSAAASRGAAPPLRMMAASLDETSADEKIARLITDHPENNVTPYIANLVGRSLHRKPAHPLGIIKSKIEECVPSPLRRAVVRAPARPSGASVRAAAAPPSRGAPGGGGVRGGFVARHRAAFGRPACSPGTAFSLACCR